VCHKLGILAHAANLSSWRKLVDALEHPEHEVDIAFVGKYVELQDSYKSLTEALAHAGAEVIQLDEPALLRHQTDFPVLQRALQMLTKHKGKAKLALYVYFGDPQPLYERLQQLPVDILGLDFTYNPKFVERVIALGSQKPLALGLVDGRNTRLEDAAAVAHTLDRILLRVKGDACYLNPSCGLEYLPRDRALAKLKLLTQIRAQTKGHK